MALGLQGPALERSGDHQGKECYGEKEDLVAGAGGEFMTQDLPPVSPASASGSAAGFGSGRIRAAAAPRGPSLYGIGFRGCGLLRFPQKKLKTPPHPTLGQGRLGEQWRRQAQREWRNNTVKRFACKPFRGGFTLAGGIRARRLLPLRGRNRFRCGDFASI